MWELGTLWIMKRQQMQEALRHVHGAKASILVRFTTLRLSYLMQLHLLIRIVKLSLNIRIPRWEE